ncbi:MAG TPA: YoaK family protein [Marmoricola sp.]|nr:YoaK family protein [Marmoricola sp.]
MRSLRGDQHADRAPAAAPAPSAADVRLRDGAVVALAMVSGATDAIGFLALGSAFTSVMTGNMVLVGIAFGTGDWSAIGLVGTAIASYVVGAGLGARLAGSPDEEDGIWPDAITRALLVELALVGTFAVVWWSLGSDPPDDWFAPLLALNAMALGVQSSAIMRFGVSGLSTTYLTGTLTTLVVRLATGHRLHTVWQPARILAALIAGATAAAALVSQARPLAPALQLVLLLAVLLAGRRLHRVGPP